MPKFYKLIVASTSKLDEARGMLIKEVNLIEPLPEAIELLGQLAEIDEQLVKSKNEIEKLFWKFSIALRRIRPAELDSKT